MKQFDFLSRLLTYEAPTFPVISVFLRTEPNETGKKDFEIFLKKQLKEHGAVFDPDATEGQHYRAAAEKINAFAETLHPSTRGAAIFASAGPEELFETFQFAVPFEENLLVVADRPHLYPIVRLVSQHPKFAVVAADTNKAHIYVFKRGQTIDVSNIQNTVTNRSEVGGWSQMRFQRHVENFHQQHAKEVIGELETIVRDEGIEHVVLSGDQTVIIPMLQDEMSKELIERVVATLSLNVDTPEHEVLEAATAAIRDKDLEADKERVANLMEHNYEDGIGVTGVDKTLAALLNGQAQALYLSSDLNQITYNRNDVRQILAAYEPGEDRELPDGRERTLLIDELLKRAASTADEIRFISDPHLLKTVGGIGAILRYQVRRVSNV